MKTLVAIAAFLALAGTAEAQYQASDSYWYFTGYSTAYTRTYTPAYYSCGRAYPSYYTYYPVANYVAPTYTPPAAKTFDDRLLEIVAASKEEDAKVAKLRAVGINLSNFTPQQVTALLQPQAAGYNGAYSLTGHAYQVVTPLSLNTYNSNSALYGDTNLNSLYLLQSQAVGQAARLFSEANGLFSSNVAQAQTGAARIAEINARRDALIAFNQALSDPKQIKSGVQWQVNPVQGGQQGTGSGGVTASDVRAQTLSLWVASAKQSCAQCHLGPDAKGKFDLETYPSMPESERQKRVYPRIDPNAAENFRMPRTADGKAGPPLDAATLQLWHQVTGPEQVRPIPEVAPAGKGWNE
jgi:hypothetical protein